MKKQSLTIFLLSAFTHFPTSFSMIHQEQVQETEQKKAFFEAVEKGKEPVVKQMLRENPAVVHARNHRDSTPLYSAIASVAQYRVDYETAKRIAQRLIRAGADIDAQDNKGSTPLHEAIAGNNPKLAYLLITHGADIDAGKPATGGSVLTCAAQFSKIRTKTGKALVSLLLGRGVDTGGCEHLLDQGDLMWQQMQLNGGKRYFTTLEMASTQTEFPLEVNKIILSMLSKPWAEHIEAIAKDVSDARISEALKESMRPQPDTEIQGVQSSQLSQDDDQQSLPLSVISFVWQALTQVDEAVRSAIPL